MIRRQSNANAKQQNQANTTLRTQSVFFSFLVNSMKGGALSPEMLTTCMHSNAVHLASQGYSLVSQKPAIAKITI